MEFCGDVGAYDVLDSYARGLKLASLQHSVNRHIWHTWRGLFTSRSWAISRRACFAFAVSFCCTMRRRDMLSLSCTLSLFYRA